MNFPKNRREMIAQGYMPAGRDRCRVCPVTIEFWITPYGRRIPMNSMPSDDSLAVSHYATCKEPERFRRKK
jgi:hypothetical protein